MKQYGDFRHLEVRVTRNLHDRLIVVNDAQVWMLTLPLKDFAVRSPATVVKVNSETANLKLGAYAEIWRDAAPLLDLPLHNSANDEYIASDADGLHRPNAAF